MHKIKRSCFTSLISQKFSVQAMHSRLASCEYARLEYWIFLMFSYHLAISKKIFSKTTFLLHLLTFGYHFLSSSAYKYIQASQKLWSKKPCPLRLSGDFKIPQIWTTKSTTAGGALSFVCSTGSSLRKQPTFNDATTGFPAK